MRSDHDFSSSRRLTRRRFLQLSSGGSSLFLLGPTVASARRHAPTVETVTGKVRGRVRDGVAEFKGIPYGASTAGENRFRPPQPVRTWAGVREVLTLGHQSPQFNPDYAPWLDISPMSEDCLVLNVFAPSSAHRTSKLPVMVWIHGGGFAFGSASSPLYDGHALAKAAGVVFVGINHRLNLFGYTYLGNGSDDRFADAGNTGHLDLMAALHWIRNNIECFGGDPANVTLFGESGGGGKVNALLGTPAARGLFQKAIVESGSIMRFRDPAEAAQPTEELFGTLGIRSGDVSALQRVPHEKLVACFKQWSEAPRPGIHPAIKLGPVVDGRALPGQPWEKDAQALWKQVPMIIGTTRHETVGFIGPSLSDPLPTDTALAESVSKYTVLRTVDMEKIQSSVQTYRRAMPELSAKELLVRMSSDFGFWALAVEQAEKKLDAGGAPVFVYECAWKTPCWGGRWAPHGIEIPFVFDIHQYGTAWDGEDSDAQRAAADPTNERHRVGSQMLAAWANFARSGDPSTTSLNWPAFERLSRPTLVFDRDSRIVNDLRSSVREALMV